MIERSRIANLLVVVAPQPLNISIPHTHMGLNPGCLPASHGQLGGDPFGLRSPGPHSVFRVSKFIPCRHTISGVLQARVGTEVVVILRLGWVASLTGSVCRFFVQGTVATWKLGSAGCGLEARLAGTLGATTPAL